MSLENAKKVLSEINKEDFKGKSIEEFELFLKENGYDCTIEELEKAAILSGKLSEDELEKVSGGKGERGKCTEDFYVQDCSSDVSADSCIFVDREGFFSSHYICTNVTRCGSIPF